MTLLLYTLAGSVAVGVPLLGLVAQRKIASERRRADRAEALLATPAHLPQTIYTTHA